MKIEDFCYIDEENAIIEVGTIEIDFMYDMNKWGMLVSDFQRTQNLVEFAGNIFPEMILTPKSIKEKGHLIGKYDPDSLLEIVGALIEIQVKKKEAMPKKKKSTFKMD